MYCFDAEIARNPATRHASPVWLADLLRADWPVRWTQLLAAGDAQAPMWLRVDSRRATAEEFLEPLRAAGIGARAEPRVPHAVLLSAPVDVHALPGFAAGRVSVQDLGAQCVAFPLALAPGLRVLDACAAPGGKTSLIAEREPRLARLVAVDVDPQRLARVADNLRRGDLGRGEPGRGEFTAELIAGDAAQPADWWDGVPFDRILLDAPCSALGVIRRHPDIRLRKSPAEIDKLPALQTRLLHAAWAMLAPGGRLVYSTCTVTRAENHDVLAAFLRKHPDAGRLPGGKLARLARLRPGRRSRSANPPRGGGCRRVLLCCAKQAMNAEPRQSPPILRAATAWLASRRLWLLLAAAALSVLAPPAPADGLDGRFEVRSADLELTEGVYHLNARVDLPVSDAVKQGLAEGVPLALELDLAIERVRQFLPNAGVAELTQHYHLQYNTVSTRYVLRNDNSGQQESLPNIEAALERLSQIHNLPVLDQALLVPGRRYEANVRAKIDYGAVPLSVRVLMFWVNEWHRESDWYTWTLQP